MGMCANLDVELTLCATFFKREKRDLEQHVWSWKPGFKAASFL